MKLLNTLLRLLLKTISLLPFFAIYLLSDLFYLVNYYMVRYRKKVVRENLKKSFPYKNELQIKAIEKGFYRHFSDHVFETIKLGSISETELKRRVKVTNRQVLTSLINQNRGVVVVMSHTGNWEWISQQVCFEGRGFEYIGVIAKEVSSNNFNEIFTYIRMRLQKGNAEIIPFKDTARHLTSIRHKTNMLITIADQTPHKDEIQYRTDFLNQDSGVFLGPERIARSLNHAVVFCHVKQISRGYYGIDLELITNSPKECAPFEITNKHVKLLEKDITEQPETWLWSHRRWKY
jgi:Kdo2-lipid IVA lauroyltransferase/acyltransferase